MPVPHRDSAPSTSSDTWLATADVARNLVRIAFRGHVTAESMKACQERSATLQAGLKPDFTVVTDLSELDSMDIDCVGDLTRMMETARTHGVGTVIRVIPDPDKDIGFNLLSIVHYRGGVRIITCESAAEAQRELDRLK